MKRLARFAAIILLVAAASACGSSSVAPAGRDVVLSWNPNRESGVNGAGGGYRVAITGQPTVVVPYVSGPLAPTTTTVHLSPGTYTVSVAAYAALDAQGGTSGTESAPSQAITVTVP